MVKYNCLNPIAAVGLDLFSDDYQKVEDINGAVSDYRSVFIVQARQL